MKSDASTSLTVAVYVVFAAFFFWSARIHSPVIDEVAHLPSGISHLQLGRFELYAVNPPLAESWAALPVVFAKPRINWSGYLPLIASRSEFIVGRRFVTANGFNSLNLFFIGRLALLPFSILAMFIASRWSQRLLCPQGAIVALLLFAFSPLILANATIVTPDVTATAIGLLALYRFRFWLQDSSWSQTFLLGLVTGLGLLTKFTWCLVFPATGLTILLFHRLLFFRNLADDFYRLAAASVLAIFIVNASYGFDRSFQPLGKFDFVSQILTQHSGAITPNRFRGTILERIPVPLPACYVLGIDVQKRDFEFGYRSYLKGTWKHGGWWYYYLIGFLVKEPIGFQLLLYISILHGLWSWRQWTHSSVREWSLVVVPALLIFGLVSSQTGFNHHMRYVLPAYPFLFVIAARLVTLGRFWQWVSYGCLTWQAAAVLWFAPHWMSYFNEAAGGPLHGHRWLVDSNIDWGQDILMLKHWQDRHPEVKDLRAALFTAFDPKDIGLKFRLPAPYIKGDPLSVYSDGMRGPQPGWYAISVCKLKGHSFSIPEGDGKWTWSRSHFTYFLDNFEPVDMIGYSIYIYHITEADAMRVRLQLLAEEAEFLRAVKGGSKEEEE